MFAGSGSIIPILPDRLVTMPSLQLQGLGILEAQIITPVNMQIDIFHRWSSAVRLIGLHENPAEQRRNRVCLAVRLVPQPRLVERLQAHVGG